MECRETTVLLDVIERNLANHVPEFLSALMSLSIFWPIDVHTSGYCYGWTKPVLCVAGVLKSDSVDVPQLYFHSWSDWSLPARCSRKTFELDR
jgi:hypothetical protein